MEIILDKGLLSLKQEDKLIVIGTTQEENFNNLFSAMVGMINQAKEKAKHFTNVNIEKDLKLS